MPLQMWNPRYKDWGYDNMLLSQHCHMPQGAMIDEYGAMTKYCTDYRCWHSSQMCAAHYLRSPQELIPLSFFCVTR